MDRSKWEYKKLGEVAIISAGQGAPQGDNNYCDNGTPFVKAGNLQELINGTPESCIQNVSEEVAKTHRLKKYKAGSVLFAKSGMSCMKGLVYTLKNDCYVVSHLAIVTPTNISSSYLNYYLSFHRPNSLIKDAAYPSISLKDIESLKISVPLIADQQRIVAELDCLNEMIALKQEQLKEFDKLAQSIFYDMFGKGCSQQQWEYTTIGNISEEVKYGTSSPATPNGRYKYLRMNNMTNDGYLDLSDLKYIDVAANDYEKYVVRKGDVLFNRTNSRELVGKTALFNYDEEMIIAGYIIRVRLKTTADPCFVVRYMNLPEQKDYLRGLCRGAIGQANINAKELQAIPIPLPPLALQQQFAQKIQAIEAQKELVKKSIAETQQLLDSRMDYYFD